MTQASKTDWEGVNEDDSPDQGFLIFDMKKKKNGRLPTVFLIVVLLIGIGFVLYPIVSNLVNSFHQSHAVQTYIYSSDSLTEDEYEELFENAYAFNERLYESGHLLTLTDEEMEDYLTQLTIESTDVMAYIRIEKIDVYLPIYHTTDEDVLQAGAGHLEGTSLPVGGENTHCVIAAHTGLPTSTLFSDLDELEIGDTFQIYVLGKTLTYEVDQILVVDPYDTSALEIVEGEDYCTLLTCTPYGVNSHRLLVRGHRIANPDATDAEEEEGTSGCPWIWICILLILLILLIIILILLKKRRERKRKASSEEMAENTGGI